MAAVTDKRAEKVQRLSDWEDSRYSIIPADAPRDRRLCEVHLRILGEIGRVNTKHGWCEFSQKEFAERHHINRTTASTAINELVRWRYVEKRGQKETKSSLCHYRVLIDAASRGDDGDVSAVGNTPQDGGVSAEDNTPPKEGCRAETTPLSAEDNTCVGQGQHPHIIGTRATRSEIKDQSPPNPRRGKRARVDDLLDQVRAKCPGASRAIDKLIEPVVRWFQFRAPDKVFALSQIAEWAEHHCDAVLADAVQRLKSERSEVVKPSDIDAALKAAIAHYRQTAHSRAAEPDLLSNADPDVAAKGAEVAEILKAQLGDDVFGAWFAGLVFEHRDENRVEASVGNKFIKSYIATTYSGLLDHATARVFGHGVRVMLTVREGRGRNAA